MNHRDYKIFAIDFDGTLCENDYPFIGKVNSKLINKLIHYKKSNPKTKYILWTCRRDKHLEAAIEWCKNMSLEIDAVNENLPEIIKEMGGDSRKIFADYYIDDKATTNIAI